jgi:hypothetical protein
MSTLDHLEVGYGKGRLATLGVSPRVGVVAVAVDENVNALFLLERLKRLTKGRDVRLQAVDLEPPSPDDDHREHE